MAEGCWGHGGGILGLVDVLESPESRSAIESDLIDKGMRLRDFLNKEDDRHTWRDLFVILTHSKPGSAYYDHMVGDASPWGLTEQLLAQIVDNQNIQIWFKTKDGEKGRNRPKPIPRPGVDPDQDVKRIGGKTKKKAADMAALLGM